jgi:hypothetical protein
MAVNANTVERKMFKYYEGLCSSSDFPKEIAKVLSLGVKADAVKDIDGNILEDKTVVRAKNWDIVYPKPDSSLGLNENDLTDEQYRAKIENQVSKISDTVILKTTTTAKKVEGDEYDDLTVDASSNDETLTMYLEIYKPAYIANPEEYPLDCERKGIIPKLITKGLYENSLKTSHAIEEAIYESKQGTCTKESLPDQTNGYIKDLTFDECNYYVKKIRNICGNESIYVPTSEQDLPNHVIDASYLAKIKQEDVELYQLFLNKFNDGEGIEPKDYVLLETVTVEVQKTGNLYTIRFIGITQVTKYSVKAGNEFKVSKTPIENLAPEYYLNGIYIPIETDLYHIDGNKIIFDEDFTFDTSVEGVLVVRYTYASEEQDVITDRVTLLNNHYVLMRLFDNIDEETFEGPKENIYNTSGEIVQTNSHVSPWSKLSWYQDFEEIFIDTIDTDVSLSSIHDGTVMVPLETVGLDSDTKMRYWINTNNDRFSLIVMGNPSLDYERDRHLISACYCGKIDSFDNSINDTAGNFALFTSSSTEPCNTVLTTEKKIVEAPNYVITDKDVAEGNYDLAEFSNFINTYCTRLNYVGEDLHVVTLSDKTYFNKQVWPKVVIVSEDGKPLTGLFTVAPTFDGVEGKADVLSFELDVNHIKEEFNDCYVYVLFSYYTEKYVITSGVSRDVFGNVIDVDKVKDYGINTSDGVTSIMMYHTRSKAYYQKHHMLFATTEEYMSKVMYGKSSYTGEYYADRIKVTHSNDGPRGTLSDLLVIDNASLYALDELVINKDFEKNPDEYEETFVFFPISAPYSPLSDSPNARYGIAIKKSELEPQYTDEEILLSLAVQSLSFFTEHWNNVDSDIYPRDTVDACSVYWKVVEDSAWIGNENTPTEYSPIQLAVVNTSEYQGDLTNKITATAGVNLSQGTAKADETTSFLKVVGFEANSGEIIAYGISDKAITSFGENAQIKVVLHDGTTENEAFVYNVQGVPYTEDIGEQLPSTDVKLVNAAPNKYLMLYSVKETSDENSETKYVITKFACVPLKDTAHEDNWLLQYPCSVNVYKEGGKGSFVYDNKNEQSITTTVEYGKSFTLALKPEQGYKATSVTVVDADTLEEVEIYTTFESTVINGVTYDSINLEDISKNLQIKVLFGVQ